MAKNVFRPQEIVNLGKTIKIDQPFPEIEEEEPEDIVEEYTGPTVDDLRREAEAFKANWDAERAQMLRQANEDAGRIIKDAEETAFVEVKHQTDEIQKKRQEAEEETKRIISEANSEAEAAIKTASDEVEIIRKNAYDEGYLEGSERGYDEGRAEVERLIKHLHMIIDKSIEKRKEIIDESETQLINLVLLIARKVVKVISENQKNVVINNVIQALRKMKSRGDVIIKVNMEDVDLTSDHVQEFMKIVENIRSITVIEDSTVDKGGCVIETDFGQIDARIASQFREIEEKIIELAPIKSKGDE